MRALSYLVSVLGVTVLYPSHTRLSSVSCLVSTSLRKAMPTSFEYMKLRICFFFERRPFLMLRDITWQRVSLPGWPACPLVASAALVASFALDAVAGVVSLRLGAIVALLALFGSAPISTLAEGGTREKET